MDNRNTSAAFAGIAYASRVRLAGSRRSPLGYNQSQSRIVAAGRLARQLGRPIWTNPCINVDASHWRRGYGVPDGFEDRVLPFGAWIHREINGSPLAKRIRAIQEEQ